MTALNAESVDADASVLMALAAHGSVAGVPPGGPGCSPANPGAADAEANRPAGGCSCPRCASTDTKFCYFNNYNVKQPRFFCKSCQRYWTAGGTLRNVQPGAGRRGGARKKGTGATTETALACNTASEDGQPSRAAVSGAKRREGSDHGSGTDQEMEDGEAPRNTRRRSTRTRRAPGDSGGQQRSSAHGGGGRGGTSGTMGSGGSVQSGDQAGYHVPHERPGTGMAAVTSSGPHAMAGVLSPSLSMAQVHAPSMWMFPTVGPQAALIPQPDAMPWAVAATMAALQASGAAGAVLPPGIDPAFASSALSPPLMWTHPGQHAGATAATMDPGAAAAAASAAALWPYSTAAAAAMHAHSGMAAAAASMAAAAAAVAGENGDTTSTIVASRPIANPTRVPSYLTSLGLDGDALANAPGLLMRPAPAALVANPSAYARSVQIQQLKPMLTADAPAAPAVAAETEVMA